MSLDRKELESVLKELVVKRLDDIAEDVRRIDANVFLVAEKTLSPIEQRQLKRGKNTTPPAPEPYAQAAKGSR